MAKYSKIGKISDDFDVVQLKSVLVKNDAGDWGNEPDNSAIGIIRSTNFNNDGKLDLTNVAYRTLSTRKFEEKKLFASDILVERSGGSETQPVGRVGYITEEIAKSDFAFANFIQRISVDETVDSKFIYYCLQHLYEMGITSGMQTQTTGIRNLDWKQYIGTYLPKPSLPEQASIANILSKVDEAIESVKKSIEAAEKLKKSLMQNLLAGRMKPDGTFRTEEEFYEDEKFGKVPIGWEVKKVKELFYINRLSLSNKTNDNYKFKYITIENVSTEHIDFENCQEFLFKDSPGRARRCIMNNDILISGVRPNLKAFAIYQRQDSSDWICSTGFHVLTAKDNVSSQFFYYQILSFIGESQFYSFVAGSNYPAIGDSDMKRMLLLVPSFSEQITISKKIEDISFYQKQEKEKIITLERLKKSLMQNLLTGKVRVGEEGKKEKE